MLPHCHFGSESEQMTTDVHTLTLTLSSGLGADGRPLLSAEEAQQRAEAIAAEVTDLGFDLQVFPWRNVGPTGDLVPYPAYRLVDSRYYLNAIGPGEKGQFAINAPGISCGDLLKLGRACELKQKLLGQQWSKEIKDQLLDHQSHLDALEELLWLGRFQGVQDVQHNVPLPSGKDMDWAFNACTQPIRIEVKNRRRENTGIVDGAHAGRNYPSWFADFAGKFSRVGHSSLNIACVTTYLEPDDALSERATEFLSREEAADAVVIWSWHCPNGRPLTLFARPNVRELLAAILAPGQREDAQKVILVEHLWRNSAEQRVVTLEETIARVREMF